METTQPLYDLVRAVAGVDAVATPATDAVDSRAQLDALSQNTDQLAQLRDLFQSQLQATQDNTSAMRSQTPGVSGSTSSTNRSDTAEKVGSGFASSLFLSPILSGLIGLFSGGGSNSDTAEPLSTFALPPSVQATADSRDLAPVSYGQNGLPRTTNINLTVTALDSQSILDRSSDIAQAVRRAMLESSSLNDVVAEV